MVELGLLRDTKKDIEALVDFIVYAYRKFGSQTEYFYYHLYSITSDLYRENKPLGEETRKMMDVDFLGHYLLAFEGESSPLDINILSLLFSFSESGLIEQWGLEKVVEFIVAFKNKIVSSGESSGHRLKDLLGALSLFVRVGGARDVDCDTFKDFFLGIFDKTGPEEVEYAFSEIRNLSSIASQYKGKDIDLINLARLDKLISLGRKNASAILKLYYDFFYEFQELGLSIDLFDEDLESFVSLYDSVKYLFSGHIFKEMVKEILFNLKKTNDQNGFMRKFKEQCLAHPVLNPSAQKFREMMGKFQDGAYFPAQEAYVLLQLLNNNPQRKLTETQFRKLIKSTFKGYYVAESHLLEKIISLVLRNNPSLVGPVLENYAELNAQERYKGHDKRGFSILDNGFSLNPQITESLKEYVSNGLTGLSRESIHALVDMFKSEHFTNRELKHAVCVSLGNAIDQISDAEIVSSLLSLVKFFSLNKYSEPQNYLEARVKQIFEREPPKGQSEVVISEKDKLIIYATMDSFSARTLIPFCVSRKFSKELRMGMIHQLSYKKYIDEGYSQSGHALIHDFSRMQDEYLEIMTRLFEEFNIIPPYSLVREMRGNRIPIEESIAQIKQSKVRLDEIVKQKDYRKVVRALAKDKQLILGYYLFYRPPFEYPGTGEFSLSFSRFEKLVLDAAEKLEIANFDVIREKFIQGFVKAGLDRVRAEQIADAIREGKPPLPKDSPYLNKEGNFIPQEVDLLTVSATNQDALVQAGESFKSSLSNMVLIFKINYLIQGISKGIEKKLGSQDPQAQELKSKYESLASEISMTTDVEDIFSSLMELNDKVYPPESRRQDIQMMMASSINKVLRNLPLYALLGKAAKKESQTEGSTIDLENVELNDLVRGIPRWLGIYKDKKEKNKLTPLEKTIIGENEVKPEHLVRILFGSFLEKLKIQEGMRIYDVFKDLEGHLIQALENYYGMVNSSDAKKENKSESVYVDFIPKFNLIEFFRFADGAHCCLTSNPAVAAYYAAGIFERQMPRYITDAPHFWFQFTTKARGEKNARQFGWFECWFGLDKNGKIIVGTELTYLNPAYQQVNIQKALLGKVEEILFSTGVSMIAQAYFGHHASNAMKPPSGYKSEDHTVEKLQSLLDGNPIYEDAKIEVNKQVTHTFYVRHNPGWNAPKPLAPKSKEYKVSLEWVKPQNVTNELIDRLVGIEVAVFPENKQAGRGYMVEHMRHPGALNFILRDDHTREIIGYRHAVPARDAALMKMATRSRRNHDGRYNQYMRDDVLYGSDVALLPQYWGKAKMGDKFRTFFKEAKKRGFKYICVHTESTNPVGPALTQIYQHFGFEVKWKEEDWGGGDTYDFLVLDLAKIDSSMRISTGRSLAQSGSIVAGAGKVRGAAFQARAVNDPNPGGIDLNPTNLNLDIQGSRGDLKFNVKNIEDIQFDGLYPIIINIVPITPGQLPLIMGDNDPNQGNNGQQKISGIENSPEEPLEGLAKVN